MVIDCYLLSQTAAMAIRVLAKYTSHSITSPLKIKSFSPLSTLNPQIFTSKSSIPKDQNSTSLRSLFHRYGLPSSLISNFISENSFLSNYNSSQIEKSLKILKSLNPSPEFLISVLCNSPRVLDYEFLKDWELGVSQNRNLNCSYLVIQNVIEVSRKFGLVPDDIRKCVMCLKGLGFSDGTISRVLEGYSMVVMMKEDVIREKVDFLERIGFDKNQIDRIFSLAPYILTYGVKAKMEPLFNEFRDLGFCATVVRKEILSNPSVLGLELGELSRCLQMLSSLKCRVPIKDKIFGEGAFRAGIEVKKRVDCLCKYGLIRRDAFKVLWKEPRIILYQVVDIEKKIEFLVNRMGFNVSWVVDVPEYLGVNFEKQIVARYNAIEYLRSKDGLGDEVTLTGIIKLSRLRFYNLYVKPYPECEKIFGRFAGDGVVKKQHPGGMWKLFMPEKHPSTKEDVKNIKSFMDSIG